MFVTLKAEFVRCAMWHHQGVGDGGTEIGWMNVAAETSIGEVIKPAIRKYGTHIFFFSCCNFDKCDFKFWLLYVVFLLCTWSPCMYTP